MAKNYSREISREDLGIKKVYMQQLTLSAKELLTTTRAVRKRLDLTRPVEREVIEECITIAQQAPTASNMQNWQFVIVTDDDKKAALAELFRRGWETYVTLPLAAGNIKFDDPKRNAIQSRMIASLKYLVETNQTVFNRLIQLLKDKRQRVKNNACTALADPDAKVSSADSRVVGSINELTWVAGHDLDGFVRRVAEDSLNVIREWVKEWTEKPPKIDVKMREEKEKGHLAMPIRRKEDHEKKLGTIRRPVLEY